LLVDLSELDLLLLDCGREHLRVGLDIVREHACSPLLVNLAHTSSSLGTARKTLSLSGIQVSHGGLNLLIQPRGPMRGPQLGLG
jgi:hypothetical protein